MAAVAGAPEGQSWVRLIALRITIDHDVPRRLPIEAKKESHVTTDHVCLGIALAIGQDRDIVQALTVSRYEIWTGHHEVVLT